MTLDIRVLFYPKTREYVVVSGEYSLRMSEEEFNSIKGTMNGIALALSDRAREKKKQARMLPAAPRNMELSISSSFAGPQSLSEDPRA